MRMLRWMSGHTRHDRIRNKCIREIEFEQHLSYGRWQNLGEGSLNMYGGIYRSPNKKSRSDRGQCVIRDRERSRKTIGEIVKKDLHVNSLNIKYDL